MKKFFFIALIVGLALNSNAYNRRKNYKKHELADSCVVEFRNQIKLLKSGLYDGFNSWDNNEYVSSKKIKPNPDLYRLFVPPTYYLDVVKKQFSLDWDYKKYNYKYLQDSDILYVDSVSNESLYADSIIVNCDSIDANKQFLSHYMYQRGDTFDIFKPKDIQISKKYDAWSNQILMKFYLQHPQMVLVNELDFKDLKPLSDELIVTSPRKDNIFNLLKPEKQIDNVNSAGKLIVVRPNFWTYKGNAYAQFTQLYISDNWYKGGESTNALLSGLILEANYNDQQRVQFENKLELKLGFITAPSDTVHRYKTNADMFRISSKLGVRARHNWYYTLASELKSQFFANYQTNTNNMISNFLTPLQLDLTLGLDFKKTTSKCNLSLLTSPLAYNFIYIKDKSKIMNSTTFNVPLGKRSVNLFGSKFSGNIDWKIIPNIIWNSKLEYFTTYETAIANWENTFTLILNKYLSTKIFVHARYDDGVKLTGDNKSYFQMQELMSFGLNYVW